MLLFIEIIYEICEKKNCSKVCLNLIPLLIIASLTLHLVNVEHACILIGEKKSVEKLRWYLDCKKLCIQVRIQSQKLP